MRRIEVLESMGVDMIDESSANPADPYFHINKKDFEIPFVCGATELSEAVEGFTRRSNDSN